MVSVTRKPIVNQEESCPMVRASREGTDMCALEPGTACIKREGEYCQCYEDALTISEVKVIA